ncbi:copper chaperone PCu(A)C [Glycocaulis sp.]|uniref:copper chaperone PCu(A)C n=1 Tax=Glycocaulis sp. TaxID=1969725 RepID=UPI003D210FAA
MTLIRTPASPATATRLGAVSLAALLLAACGDAAAPGSVDEVPETTPAAHEAEPASDIQDAAPEVAAPELLSGWVRTPPAGRDVTAGYVSLRAGAEDDQLVGASSPIASRVELHTMEDDGEVMRMRQVEAIDLPAGETVALAPGGDHLMIFGVDTASLDGEVEMTLEFASGAASTVRLPLSFTAPEADAGSAE